jgi:hypothetical protein
MKLMMHQCSTYTIAEPYLVRREEVPQKQQQHSVHEISCFFCIQTCYIGTTRMEIYHTYSVFKNTMSPADSNFFQTDQNNCGPIGVIKPIFFPEQKKAQAQESIPH